VALPTILSQEAAYAGNTSSSHADHTRPGGTPHGSIPPGHSRIHIFSLGGHHQHPFSFNQLLAHAEAQGINKALAFDTYYDAAKLAREHNVPAPIFKEIAKDFAGSLREAGDDLDAVARIQGAVEVRIINFQGGHIQLSTPPRFRPVENLAQLENKVAQFRQGANNGDRLLVRATDQTTGTHVWFNLVKTRDVSNVPDEQKSNPEAGTPMVLFGDSRRPGFGPAEDGYLRPLGEDGVGGRLSENDRENLHNFQVLFTN
jgi:hypothetical protein